MSAVSGDVLATVVGATVAYGLTRPGARERRRAHGRLSLWIGAVAGPAAPALAIAGIAGTLAAWALGDPFALPLALGLTWSASGLVRRVNRQRRLLERTRRALPFLTRVQQEIQAGAHPVAALVLAHEGQPSHPWLARQLVALGRDLGRGEPLARAATAWARREEVPVLRLFAHLLALHATWGVDLGAGLARLTREADQSVAFGAEQRAELRLYEAMTVAFLVLDVALGAAALAGWPRAVPSPLETPWGRALLVGSALSTVLAVAVPFALGADAPDGDPVDATAPVAVAEGRGD